METALSLALCDQHKSGKWTAQWGNSLPNMSNPDSTVGSLIISIPSVFFKWVHSHSKYTSKVSNGARVLQLITGCPHCHLPISTVNTVLLFLWTQSFEYQYLNEIKWSVNSIFECKDLRSVRCLFASICWAASSITTKCESDELYKTNYAGARAGVGRNHTKLLSFMLGDCPLLQFHEVRAHGSKPNTCVPWPQHAN